MKRKLDSITDRRRRSLLKSGAGLLAFGAAASFTQLLSRRAAALQLPYSPDYGALVPVVDETTGLELLLLPPGFRCISYGWTGDALMDGTPTPPLHDGMGVAVVVGHGLVLVRNHENPAPLGAFAPPQTAYDVMASGGATSLKFSTKSGRWLASWWSLNGTSTNCAGGATPWKSWLSCEETLAGPELGFAKTHGWVFEIPRGAPVTAPTPLTAMGRFKHEAVAVEPVTGHVYETEDRSPCGFYRFVPRRWGKLGRGGALQMLRVTDLFRADLRGAVPVGSVFDVEWVDIAEPSLAHSPGTTDSGGVFKQGFEQGGASFKRLEGCWHEGGRIYFVSTNGGAAGCGQIWVYDTRRQTLALLFESPSRQILNRPDNVVVSPRGSVILCEDGGGGFGQVGGDRMLALTPDGALFPFAENNIVLDGGPNGISGDFRSSEWAGATFSPDGRWLFANVQLPGITFAITGPWDNGAI